MRRERHVARMSSMRDFTMTTKDIRHLGKLNTVRRIILKWIWSEVCVQWSNVDYWALVNTVMNCRVAAKAVNFLLSRATFKFVRNAPRDRYGACQSSWHTNSSALCTEQVTVCAVQTKQTAHRLDMHCFWGFPSDVKLEWNCSLLWPSS
jgi:hypothetical protein